MCLQGASKQNKKKKNEIHEFFINLPSCAGEYFHKDAKTSVCVSE
jgi:hypothetical protein